LAASIGALCAVLALLDDSVGRGVDHAVVATVNGTRLELTQYQRAVRLFSSEKRSAVTPEDRALILERMIEEELLLQYGVEIGLVRNNQAVRAEVLQSVTTSLMAELNASAVGSAKTTEHLAERERHLADYLGLLRDGAAIRRVVSGVEP
jgi:hypothetical protein